MKKIYLEHELVLGRIVYDAKCRIISQYCPTDSLYGPAVLTNLMGDPALRIKYGPPVAVDETKTAGASGIGLDVRPNPCHGPTMLRIGIRGESAMPRGGLGFRIYDATGRLIKILSLPTTYSLLPTAVWDGSDQTGNPVPSGVYLVRAQADGVSETKTFLLIR